MYLFDLYFTYPLIVFFQCSLSPNGVPPNNHGFFVAVSRRGLFPFKSSPTSFPNNGRFSERMLLYSKKGRIREHPSQKGHQSEVAPSGLAAIHSLSISPLFKTDSIRRDCKSITASLLRFLCTCVFLENLSFFCYNILCGPLNLCFRKSRLDYSKDLKKKKQWCPPLTRDYIVIEFDILLDCSS